MSERQMYLTCYNSGEYKWIRLAIHSLRCKAYHSLSKTDELHCGSRDRYFGIEKLILLLFQRRR